MRRTSSYRIEMVLQGNWHAVCQDSSLAYTEGRFDGFRAAPGPRPACRIVQVWSDGVTKVRDELPEKPDLALGQIVGTDMSAFRMKAIVRALHQAAIELDQKSHHLAPDQLRSCAKVVESILDSMHNVR